MRKKLAGLLLFTFLLSIGYAAFFQLRSAALSVSHYQPSAPEQPLTIGNQLALTSRVLLVLLDGWRPDAATSFASVHYLRRQGAAYTLAAPPPTWKRPTWATLLTGAPPAEHGVLLDRPGGPLTIDNLVQAAGRRGVEVSLVGHPGLAELVSPWLDRTYPAREVAAVQTTTIELLTNNEAPPLLIIHLDASNPTQQLDIDLFLMELMRHVDLAKETLIISGTYAVDRQGRHGSGHPQQSRVPLVMAGRGVHPGEYGQAQLTDLTPTVATLLGLPLPTQALGTPLFTALTISGEPLAHRQAEVAAARARAAPSASVDPWQIDWSSEQPYLLGAALVLVIYLILVNRGKLFLPFVGSLALYLTVYHALFFSRGGRYDLSLPGLGQPDQAFLLNRGVEIAVAWALTAVAIGWAVGRRAEEPGDKGLGSLYLLGSFAALFALAALVPIGLWGLDPRPVLLSPTWVLPYLALLSHGLVLGAGAPLWLLISLLTAQFAQGPEVEATEDDPDEQRVVEIEEYRKQRRANRRGANTNR